MDLLRKAVHEGGKFDLLVFEAADEFTEFLLRRNDDPVFASSFSSEILNDGLKVEHLLHIAGDELAHFVDHEHQAMAGLSALHQLRGSVGKLSRRNVGLVFDSLNP